MLVLFCVILSFHDRQEGRLSLLHLLQKRNPSIRLKTSTATGGANLYQIKPNFRQGGRLTALVHTLRPL